MTATTVVCLSIVIMIAISQQVEGSRNNQKILSQLANKIHLQSDRDNLLQRLVHAASSQRSNLEHASSQGKAKRPNLNCPDFSETKKLYRVTRFRESCQDGLLAKNTDSDDNVLYHVRRGSSKSAATKFISTTTSLDIAQGKYWPKVKQGGALVEITVIPSSCNIVNLNDEATRERLLGENPFAFNFARKDCEVLLDCKKIPVYCKVLKRKEPRKRKRTDSPPRKRKRTESPSRKSKRTKSNKRQRPLEN